MAKKCANMIGYPVLVRPSYVLGGRAMRIVYDESELEHYIKEAVDEGIVPGGGVAFLLAARALDKIKCENDDEQTGVDIVKKAMEAPLRQIALNAGQDGGVVVMKVSAGKPGHGFDAAKLEFDVDMVARGIIDPKKVSREALENASSLAALFLTTECAVVEKPKEEKASPMGMPPGGMGGDY